MDSLCFVSPVAGALIVSQPALAKGASCDLRSVNSSSSSFVANSVTKSSFFGKSVAEESTFEASRTFNVQASWSLPLLPYSPKTQNFRVKTYGYDLSDEKPVEYTTEFRNDPIGAEEVIWAAYRQIFSEHQILKANRQPALESQFKFGEISTKEFIRGLVTSEAFIKNNFYPNDNYRFVQILIQRVLGRDVFNETEKIAWSIIIATKGVGGFISALLDGDEYMSAFGDFVVPYQRSRVLPQREIGEVPFNLKTPRYGPYWRNKLGFPNFIFSGPAKSFVAPPKKDVGGDPKAFLKAVPFLNIQQNEFKVPVVPRDYLSLVPNKKK